MACCRMQRNASVSLPNRYCACGESFGIVFGEADPPAQRWNALSSTRWQTVWSGQVRRKRGKINLNRRR